MISTFLRTIAPFRIPNRKYTLQQIMNHQKEIVKNMPKDVKCVKLPQCQKPIDRCLINVSMPHCMQFVLPSFSTCVCPRPKK